MYALRTFTARLLNISCVAALFVSGMGTVSAQSDSWPSRPIKLVAPSATGGATDLVGRILGRFLEQELKQAIIVEAKPGAGAVLGAQFVKTSLPDGYTFLISGSSTHSANPWLFSKLPYDPEKDFRDVGMVGYISAIGLVNKALPVRSVAELIQYAKANPGKLNYGHATSSSQVPPALIAARAELQMTAVPYKSLAQIITDLAGGTLDFAFLDVMSASPALQNPAIVAIATTSPQRLPLLKDVPAVSEALAGFEVQSWIGIAAPAEAAQSIIDKMSAALAAALRDSGVRASLERLGMTIQSMTPDQLTAFVTADRKRWGEWVKLAKIESQ